MIDRTVVIWHVTDGKTGHVNQVRGLIRALSRRVKVDVHRIAIQPTFLGAMSYFWRPGFAPDKHLPKPDLILTAGNKTHTAAMKARRVYGGKVVVLMAPQMPRQWFDLCLIPMHDDAVARDNTVVTRGVLNDVDPSDALDPKQGLFLIGGPSKHHGWDDAQAVAQIEEIVSHDRDVQWTLTTSRRTPASFEAAIKAVEASNLKAVPVAQTDADWVREHVGACGRVWVTEDSVSMIYEALTAGASVGVLQVPRARAGKSVDDNGHAAGEPRVMAGLRTLNTDGWVTSFKTWQDTHALTPPPERLHEAERCADIVLERCLGVKGSRAEH